MTAAAANAANNRRGSSRLASQSAAPLARTASGSPDAAAAAASAASASASGKRTVFLGRLPGPHGIAVRFLTSAEEDEDGEADDGEDASSPENQSEEEDDAAAAQTTRDTARLRAQRARRSPSASPVPRNGIVTGASGGAASPTASAMDSDNDTPMKDALDPRSSPSPSSPNSVEEKEEAEQAAGSAAAAPPPVRLVRSSMVIPTVPARKERVFVEDLPPYVRPALRHVVTEEKRVVQVRPKLNLQRYPEQLIDSTMTLKTYLPSAAAVAAATASTASSHLMSPFTASRTLPPHLAGHHLPRALSLSHSPGFLGRRQTSANGAGAAFVGSSPPGSPKPRGLLGGAAGAGAALTLPQTPAMHRQSSQLTHPLQSMLREGPPTNIVTQLIPYGRIHIVPARIQPQLCASMVPLSVSSSAHSWYLPKSQASRVHIQLELPGGVDFEIVVDNVFVMPDKVDKARINKQQQSWGMTPPPAVNNASATAPSSAAAAPGSASAASSSASFHVPSQSSSLLSHVAHPSSKRRTASSTRLERKKDRRTETERMLDEEDAAAQEKVSPSRPDPLTLDLQRAYGHLTKFGPPKLRDVRVSIRSKGQTLVPEPAHSVEVPTYANKELLTRKVAAVSRDPAAHFKIAHPSAPVNEATIAAAGTSAPALTFLRSRGDGWRGAADDPSKDEGRAPHNWVRATERSKEWGVDCTNKVRSTRTEWVGQGPNALSVSNPRIEFAGGSITLERGKPRVGGWVVRRELSLQAATKYVEANPDATESQVAKMFPAPVSVKKEEGVAVKKEEDASGPIVKMEDVPQTPPRAAAAASATPAAFSPAKAPTTVTFVPRAPSPMPPVLPAASVWEPEWVTESRHDIAEVGDVIRLELHIPAPPPKPKSKPIKPMRYELVIEGIRVLPTSEAPSFPDPLDMYRYGTAPREMVVAAAQRNYLTSSVVPSHRLGHAGPTHWSELGRPAALHNPIVLPDALLPHGDSLSEQAELLNELQHLRFKVACDPNKLADHSMLQFFRQHWSKDAVLVPVPRPEGRVSTLEMVEACAIATDFFVFGRVEGSQYDRDVKRILRTQGDSTRPDHSRRAPGLLREMMQVCCARLGTDVIFVADEDLPIQHELSEELVAEGRAIFKAGPEIPRRAVPALIGHVAPDPFAPHESDLTDDHSGLLEEGDSALVSPHRSGMPIYILLIEKALFILLTPLQVRMRKRGPLDSAGSRARHLGDVQALKEMREHELKFGIAVPTEKILTEMKEAAAFAAKADFPMGDARPPSPLSPPTMCSMPSKNEWRPAPDRSRYSALIHHPQAYDDDALSDSDLSNAQTEENAALLSQYNELLDDDQGDSSDDDSDDGEDDEDESGEEDEHDDEDGDFESDEDESTPTSKRIAPGSGSKNQKSSSSSHHHHHHHHSHQHQSRAVPASGAAADKQRPQGSSSAKSALFKPGAGSKIAAGSSSSSRPSSSSQSNPSQKRQPASSSSSSSRAQSSAAAAAAAAEDDSGWDESVPEEVWACCDKCGKWRKLPPGFKDCDLPEVWHCSMNPDVTHNLCKYPQEEESQDSYPVNSSSSAAAGGGSRKASSSAASSSRAKDDEKANEPTPVSHAVQQAHLALLYPPPRVPTHEDVCTFCEQVLAKPEDGLAPLFTPEQTLMCHGPCARIWHRKCVQLDEGAQKSAQGVNAVVDQQRDAALSVTESGEPLYVEAGPNCGPTTHVYPFTPKISKYWYCSDCIHLRGYCFSCFKAGTCDPALERVPNPAPMVRSSSSSSSANKPKYSRTVENEDFLYQCPFTSGCGKMYHRKCLFNLPRTMTHKPSRGGKDANMAPPQPNLVPRPRAGLTCSQHMCCSCQLAGTVSTNVRDIGRTLVQCLRCPSAYHWTTKCRRPDCCFVVHTRKYGVCDDHDPNAHPDDAEDADLVARRKAAQAQVKMHHAVAPEGLWGTEPRPVEESDSDDDDEDDDEEGDEGEEEEEKKPAAAKSGGAGTTAAAAGAKNKAEKAEPEERAGKKQRL